MFQNSTKEKTRGTTAEENAMSDFKGSKDQLQGDTDRLRRDARDAAKRADRSLREVARETGEQFQDFLNTKKDQVQDARVSAERTIRSNPIAATAAAFAVGALLARLMRRR